MPRSAVALLVVMVAGVQACGQGGAADAGDADAGADGLDADGEVGDGAAFAEPYSVGLLEQAWISSLSGEEGFQNAEASFELDDGPFESVTLVVDLDSPCFPFERWADDPPPPGHNWPASCDAFDRTLAVTLDHPTEEGDPPPLELLRAITPFGGPLHVETDVTDVANGLPGPHELRVHVSTWPDPSGQVTGAEGGWTVSASLAVVPGPPPRSIVAVLPLFSASVGADTMGASLPFAVPPSAAGGRIEYRVTGHGGAEWTGRACIGPAEEFCRRVHTIRLDGAELDVLDPWRADCAELCTEAEHEPWGLTYCAENPCGAMASVRAPRANWCPGSVTPPFVWEPPDLATPGDHHFEFEVNAIAEGGIWTTSVALFLYGE